MGENKIKAYPLRIDEELHKKLDKICLEEGRNKNKEIEWIIRKYIRKYEEENGKI